MTGSCQVTELWRRTSNNLRLTFHRNRAFSNATYCYWLKWRYYAWRGSGYDHIWPVTLHLDLSEVIPGHWPWPTPYLPIVAKFVVLRVSWASESECVVYFWHRPVFKAHFLSQMSIRDFLQVCPRAIWLCFLRGCFTSQIFDQDTKTIRRSNQDWT